MQAMDGERRLRPQIAPNTLQPINKSGGCRLAPSLHGDGPTRNHRTSQDHDDYELRQYPSAAAGFGDESGTAKRNAATGRRAPLGGPDREVPAARRPVRDLP